MAAIRPTPGQRLGSASLTALVTAALGYAFIAGLGVAIPHVASEALVAFAVAPPPPPPPPEPAPKHSSKRQGAAAPANLKSKATPVVAPPPVIPITPPPLINVAPKPGLGGEVTIGAAPVPGPGTGAGGQGNGTGSGGSGNGEGAGDVPPRQIAGKLSIHDLPPEIKRPGRGGTVSVLYVVTPRGRATDCQVTHSSGDAQLDDLTCRLIEQRFRFDPSRHADGRPVESMVEEDHTWVVD